MKNDLISRKWLTDAIRNRRTYLSYEDAKDVIDLIDNAPTVEDTPNILQSNFSIKQYKADLQASHDCGYTQGYIDGSMGAEND